MMYLIKFSLFLLVLYGFYKLVLVRTNHFQANRFILLLGILLAILYPMIEIPHNEVMAYSLPVQEVLAEMSNTKFEVSAIQVESDKKVEWADYLVYIWLFGAILFACTFVITLINWNVQLSRAKAKFLLGVQVYFGKHCEPSSFFGRILMPDEIKNDEQSFDYILAHEMAHVKLGHSWDRTFLAMIKVVFWWHPLVWFIEKELCLIHEYSADQMAIAQPHSSKKAYAQILLANTMGLNSNQLLIPSFYQSPLKKRFIMISKFVKSSKQYLYLLIVPVLFVLAYGCQEEQLFSEDYTYKASDKWLSIAENSTDEVFKVVESMPAFPGDCDQDLSTTDAKKCADGALLEYLGNNVVYPKLAAQNGTGGVAVVTFIVEKDGRLSDIELLRDIEDGCGEEALRAIQQMQSETIWKPGIQDGMRVRTRFNLPIRFKLKDDVASKNNPPLPPVANRINELINSEELPSPPKPSKSGRNDVFRVVSQMPRFIADCEEARTRNEKKNCSTRAMLEFLSENTIYPKLAFNNKTEGTAVVSFVVEVDGSLSDIKVIRDPGDGTGEEAKRVVELMKVGHWIPGQQDGITKPVQYHLPIMFKLK